MVIEFEDVSVFGDDGEGILRDVSFKLKNSIVTGLIGPKYSGKSTCLRLMAGLTSADKGRVLIDGEMLAPDGPAEGVTLTSPQALATRRTPPELESWLSSMQGNCALDDLAGDLTGDIPMAERALLRSLAQRGSCVVITSRALGPVLPALDDVLYLTAEGRVLVHRRVSDFILLTGRK